jgi:murein DD-endopeptidase MepM/ murein hydrolase activator NlpD
LKVRCLRVLSYSTSKLGEDLGNIHKRRRVIVKKGMAIGLAAVIGLSGIVATQPYLAHASTKEILEKKQQIIKEKQESIRVNINQTKEQITSIEKEKEKIDEEIKRLDFSVTETNHSIREKEKQIATLNKEMEKTQKQLEKINKRIQIREEILKKRVLAIQENGGINNYLDVLLGAESFTDFIANINAISTIINADRELLQEQLDDRTLKEKREAELRDTSLSIKENIKELEELKKTLNEQILEKNELMKSMSKQQVELEEEVVRLEEEARLLAAQEAAIKKEMEAYERRVAEAKRQGGMVGLPEITDGAFIKPTIGIVTSGFGERWDKLHAGIDIANPAPTVPVVAAADGTVIRSYYSSTYGNVVFITHNIDGQIYTTVYAHLDERIVKDGETVKKGQLIGYMGNTGRSFGKHLHFEFHVGSWNIQKTNAVDPRKYISFD